MPRKTIHRRPEAARLRHREVATGHTREDILLAAARVLGRRGFGSISMQDVASEVGFSAPALYGYFASKEEIFAELGRTLERELAETFAPPPPRLSFRGRVSCLVRRQLEWSDRRRDVFLAFMTAHCRGEGHPHNVGERPQGPEAYLARLSTWLRAAAGPDDLHGLEVDEVACVLMGISHGFFLRWLVAGPGSSERLADQTERILELFFFGVAGHGVAGPPVVDPVERRARERGRSPAARRPPPSPAARRPRGRRP